jgi:hypothetical protein
MEALVGHAESKTLKEARMASTIRPNRLEVSDRFPVLGFTVKTGKDPWFEVALA